MRSPTFILLALAGGLFSTSIFGLTLNFVPILQAGGITTNAAVGAAALIGLGAIVGRLATGALLDRFSAGMVGSFVFSLPAIVCALLWLGQSTGLIVVASVILGLASGAEVDVIAYVTAKRFDRGSFGILFGLIIAVLNVSLALGPLLAGAIFDRFHTYTPFLVVAAVLAMLSAACIRAVGVAAPGSAPVDR